jgi:hypothetical protein
MTWITRCLTVLLALCLPAPAFAQAAFTVRGSVLDPTGAGIAGATVLLESSTGATVSQSKTDTRGSFALPNLPAGTFSLVAPAYNGFAARTIPLHVTGDLANVKLTLHLDTVKQEVTVGADAPPLSTDSSDNRDTVATTGDQLRKLPVFDQDPIALLSTFLDSASGSTGGTTIVVDGVEMKSAGVSASAIQEIRVNNDPYSAEFTRPGRGRIEIITKPGTPQYHGEANFTYRNSIFNATYFPAVTKPPKTHYIFEGHLSGPVGHGGHTSFISSGSLRQRNISAIVDAVTPTGPVIENVLTNNRDYQASMRLTHDFSANHRLSLGYNVESHYDTNQGIGGIVLPEAGYNQVGREDDAIFNDRIILSPTLINQLQVTLEKDEDVTTSLTNAQSINVSGAFVGGGAQADLARTENTIHVTEVVTWSHGKHYLRAGVQLPQFSRRAVDDHTNRLGTFDFSSLATYQANTPYSFTAQSGVGRGLYWINEFGSFVQDQIKLNPHTQLALGLRYDWQTFLHDNNNLAPRISLAYAPGKGKTILRTGVGVFYDRTGGDNPATVILHNGAVLRSIQVLNPPFPHTVSPSDASLPPSIVRFDPHVRSPYAFQYSLGVEHQIHKTVTVTANYRGQVQVKSFRSRDANAPILPPNPVLTANYPRPDPNYGEIQQIESGGRTLLNALELGFRGQAGRIFSGQAQYILSRFEGNTNGINWFPQDQYRPNDNWARSPQDRLQAFNVLGNINPGHWLSLGVGASLTSGMPYNETTGNDDYHTGLGNARPAGVGRNTLQGGGVADLDLLYDHDFFLTKSHDDNARAVSVGLSAFNVLNRTNYTSYIGTLTSSRFGQPTSANAGRQLQFSLGYRF